MEMELIHTWSLVSVMGEPSGFFGLEVYFGMAEEIQAGIGSLGSRWRCRARSHSVFQVLVHIHVHDGLMEQRLVSEFEMRSKMMWK